MNKPLVSIFALFLILGSLVIRHTPPFESPDELAHLLYMVDLYETQKLPILSADREAVFSSQSTHHHHPPLYYLGGALLLNVLPFSADDLAQYRHENPLGSLGMVNVNNQHVFLHPQSDNDFLPILYLLRAVSLIISCGTLWLIYRIGRALDGRMLGLISALFVACIPTFLFISANVNNDTLTTFFYTAGIGWLIARWQAQTLSARYDVLLGLVLSGMALTKFNGVSLFGVVYGGMVLGVWLKRWSWRDALRTLLISGGMVFILAGWWYVRNYQLYGDPLALNMTKHIWGRTVSPQWGEIEGVWLSFWGILGQFNIRLPLWLFVYALFVTVGGLAGAVIYTVQTTSRWAWLVLWGVVALVMASLLVATLQVNISQGRLLYPMLGAFSVLVMQGWRVWLKKYAGVILLPFIVAICLTPFWIKQVYQPLKVEPLPQSQNHVDAMAGDFILLASDFVLDDDLLTLKIWFDVLQPPQADYAFAVAVLDGRTGDLQGSADVYLGMTRTSTLTPLAGDDAYYAEFDVKLSSEVPFAPHQSQLEFKWVRFDQQADKTVITSEILAWENTDQQSLGESILVAGPTLVDDRYHPPIPPVSMTINFGDQIILQGIRLKDEAFHAGDWVELSMWWDALDQVDHDWTLSVQLLDADNQLIAQSDAPPLGYPTSRWQSGQPFIETRTLFIPDDIDAGTYRIIMTWYRDEMRLGDLQEIVNIVIIER